MYLSPVNKPARPCRGMTSSSQDSHDVRYIATSSKSPADVFISSDVTRSTGCGAADFPWILEAPEGQKIGLSILDFSLNGTKPGTGDSMWGPLDTGVCMVYASVRDGQQTPGAQRRTSTICGRIQPRMRHVFTSSSNYIELRILQSDVTGTSVAAQNSKRPRFIIKYEGKDDGGICAMVGPMVCAYPHASNEYKKRREGGGPWPLWCCYIC